MFPIQGDKLTELLQITWDPVCKCLAPCLVPRWCSRNGSYPWDAISHWSEWSPFKKYTNNKCWRGCGGKRTLLHCWWECKFVQPLWKTVKRFLKKFKTELTYDPAISILGIYSEKNIIEKDPCTPMFTAVIFTILKIWVMNKKCPWTDQWIKRCVIYVYTHTGVPWWLSGKESTCQCRRLGFNPWVRKIPWRRK